MKELNIDLLIVGGGPAGMAAAVAAFDEGLKNLLIIERDSDLSGILRQCIHNGFGLHRFGEELTGPEYAYRYVKMVKERNIPFMTDTIVTDIKSDKTVTAQNAEYGIFKIHAGAIILAMGCRERPKGALNIAGKRPAGIYTAGTAQKFVNIKGYMPGREVVILGSGDIGLIMARRMTLEGANVKAVLEIMPYSGGLARNIEQCLNDFNIPLMLKHTVTKIHGDERLVGVTVSEVDEFKRPIPGTEVYISCDTLLLSCGLIPENELTKSAGIELSRVTGGAVVNEERQTEIEGIFACGNVLHVHDLVDFVSEEAEIAGRAAVRYLRGEKCKKINVKLNTGIGVRYTVPSVISEIKDTKVYFRVTDVMRDKRIVIKCDGAEVFSKKKIKFAPGEMESITLSDKIVAQADGKILTVSVEA